MRILQLFIVIAFLGFYIVKLPRIITKRDFETWKLLIIEICLQNFISILASNVTNKAVVQFIILYKEIAIYGAIFYYYFFIKRGKFKIIEKSILLMMLICVVFFFISDVALYARLISLRQLITPIVLILYGFTYEKNSVDNKEILTFVVKLGMVQALFGFLERFVLRDKFWIGLHIEKYMEYKGFSRWVFVGGIPGDFYSADLYSLVGSIRRLAGLFAADPILTGHFIALCIVILLYVDIFDRMKNLLYLVVMTIALLLTLCKGAILIVGVAYWYKIYRYNKVIGLMTISMLVAVVAFIVVNNIFSTVAIHVRGLTSSLDFQHLIGKGIGKAGNLASVFGGSSSTAGESYIGMIIGQMGLLGLATFVYIIVALSRRLIKGNKSRMSYALVAYIISVLIESFLSESAINFVGSGVAFLLFGKMVAECTELKNQRPIEFGMSYSQLKREIE